MKLRNIIFFGLLIGFIVSICLNGWLAFSVFITFIIYIMWLVKEEQEEDRKFIEETTSSFINYIKDLEQFKSTIETKYNYKQFIDPELMFENKNDYLNILETLNLNLADKYNNLFSDVMKANALTLKKTRNSRFEGPCTIYDKLTYKLKEINHKNIFLNEAE